MVETLERGTMDWTDAAGARSKLDADKLAVDFGAKGKAQQLVATGSVHTEREAKGSSMQQASALSGIAEMNATGEWSKITLRGNVRIKEGDRNAESEEAVMIRNPQTAVLAGKVVVRDATSETRAAKISFFQATGDIQAEGNVRSTELSAKTGSVQLAATPANLSSDHLEASAKSGKAVYSGHARMWQGPSVLEADSIELQRETRRVIAVGNVRGVFPQAATKDGARKSPSLWHVSCTAMTYWDSENRAKLEKNVAVQSADQKMRSEVLDLYFSRTTDGKAGGASQITRAVGTGGVVVEQGARRGTADTGVYTADDQKFVMSGGNPTLYDASEGTTTGRQLTFYISG